jgi:thymidylate synthase
MEYLHEDGTPFTKEEFLQKLKTDKEFNDEFGNKGIDQIQNLIKDLKTNPDSRRLLVSAWNPSDLPNMVLPPCHYGFQVYTRELSLLERYELMKKLDNWVSVHYKEPKTMEYMDSQNIPTRAISLMYNARSQDVPLGTPFNISSYALLLVIIGKMVNMVPDELITNMGDCHIYLNQIDGVREQITREPFELPELVMSNQINFNESVDEFLNSCLITDFIVENYQSHPTIKMPLSN